MNPLDYCYQKAAAPGSGQYYAILQAPVARRPALLGLIAYRRELAETVRNGSDPSVARAKLDWWRGETQRLVSGEPSHPVTQTLRLHIPSLAADSRPTEDTIAPLFSLIAGFDADLMQARYLDYPGLKHYFNAVDIDFTALLAHVVRAPDAALPPGTASSWEASLGLGLALTAMIVDTGADARHGRIYLPISEMQQFGVTAADILNRRYSDAFTALMQFQTSRAQTLLQDGLRALPVNERRLQRLLRAQAAIATRELDEIASAGFQILHQKISLTPLRNLWAAWWGARKR